MDVDISAVILCSKKSLAEANSSTPVSPILPSAVIEVGGNAFDNAHIYGQGSMEKLLGDWHRKRDNLKDLVIIAKGAHTPNCDPKSITSQLTESLDRLQTETAVSYTHLTLPTKA